MKKALITLLLPIISLSTHAQSETPQQCIESFFVAFHQKDTADMRSALHEEIVIKTIANIKEGPTSIMVDNADDFLNSFAKIPDEMAFREEIESYKVEEDGKLAHVWTPYSFYVNEQLSHTGVNSFVLVNFDGKWKIVHLIDTRVKTGLK